MPRLWPSLSAFDGTGLQRRSELGCVPPDHVQRSGRSRYPWPEIYFWHRESRPGLGRSTGLSRTQAAGSAASYYGRPRARPPAIASRYHGRARMIANQLATQEQIPRSPIAAAGPCVLVIFGATGDLTKRLLMPSLYNLAKQKLLPDSFAIIGVARPDPGGDQGFREKVQADLLEFGCEAVRDATMDWLTARLSYVSCGFDEPNGYETLKTRLADMDTRYGTQGNYLFYFAIAPEFFLEVPRQLSRAGLLEEAPDHWRRIIIEKPFGHDLASARQLNHDLLELVGEQQIYRIDHYLGKETVQNIIVFRFANGIFEPLWNRRYIDHVQITVAETVSVEQRGGYYEKAGALRDMVPNHLLQLLALTAMESPLSFSAEALRYKQDEALLAIQPIAPKDIGARAVRGQYGAGVVEEKPVVAYREAPQV